MTQIVVPVAAGEILTLRDQVQSAADQGADLVELRLDSCVAAGAQPRELLADIGNWPLPVLVTNRHRDEGGDWHGDEDERLALLAEADRHGAALVDIELACWERRRPPRPQRARLVLSHHDFSGMGRDLADVVERMYTAGADVAKVAVTPRDAADLDVLAGLCARWGRHAPGADAQRALVALGMGEYGLPSRLLAGAWGMAFTFARLDGAKGSAPGQPLLRDLVERYRVRHQGPETRIFGVLGKPVGHSLSPLIHNTAFAQDNLDAVYVPFLADDALGFWQACGKWIDGLSITIPHKAVLLGEMDELEELAMRIGAMNTVYRGERGECIGANTDAPAAVTCVENAAGSIADRRVLLLGAGGVSRAIAFAMSAAGAHVTIANRTRSRAEGLAQEIGCKALSLEEAYELPYDVLINATSVGMESEETPWPAERHRAGTVVFDTVYTPLETRLLKEAQEAEAIPVCGLSMLIEQALGQYERWTGIEAPEPLMHRVALEALSTRWTHVICRGREPAHVGDRDASGIHPNDLDEFLSGR